MHLTVMTSWVAYYLDPQQRIAFEQILATAGRPISWISAEHKSIVRDLTGVKPPKSDSIDIAQIGIVSYPADGKRPERDFIAWSHNHGLWLDWQNASLSDQPT